MLHSFDHQIG